MCKNKVNVRLFIDIRLAFMFIIREMSHFRMFGECNKVPIKSFSIEHLSSQYQIEQFVSSVKEKSNRNMSKRMDDSDGEVNKRPKTMKRYFTVASNGKFLNCWNDYHNIRTKGVNQRCETNAKK